MNKSITLVLLSLTGCYLKQYPVTEKVARASTYTVIGQLRDETEIRSLAWVADDHHLVTTGDFCLKSENIVLRIGNETIPVFAHADDNRLCVLDVPENVGMGPQLVVAREPQRGSRYLTVVGSPIWTRHGVVGVILGVDAERHATAFVGHAELTRFLKRHHVDFVTAPLDSDTYMDPTCQGIPRELGMCSVYALPEW